MRGLLILACLLVVVVLAGVGECRLRGEASLLSNTDEGLQGEKSVGTVFYDSSRGLYSLEEGVVDKQAGVAWGVWRNEVDSTGWARITVVTNSAFPDNVQAYAAGFFEGHFSHHRIYTHFENSLAFTFPNETDVPQDVQQFFRQQLAWAHQQVQEQSSSDAYWYQVGLTLSQFDGLVAGYNSMGSSLRNLTAEQLELLTAFGDLFDILPAVRTDRRPDIHTMSPQQILDYQRKNSHCSALIRVTPGLDNLFSGHTSWFRYQAMNRIFKRYYLNFNHPSTTAKRVVFSSYPAELSSNDDFYVTSAGLSVIETTNNIWDKSLYDLVVPQSLLTWQRVIVANRMSSGGKQWSDTFEKHNSGTYNCQWMVVDYKQFELGQEKRDMTMTLNSGYWPSYNVPYFKKIYDLSGYPEAVKKAGPAMAPRAVIFRDRAHKVNDLESMRKFMRYNNFESDPLAHMDPGAAVASRFDLEPDPARRSPDGGYDSKITSYGLMGDMVVEAISGPTTVDQPAFNFDSPEWQDLKHMGMPAYWDFKWQTMDDDEP